jgi:DNA-binding NtrC family response regulator
VLAALQEYRWPGNIRELRNVIERAVALCPGPNVQLLDLPEVMRQASGDDNDVDLPKVLGSVVPGQSNPTLAQSKEAAEIVRIKEALDKHNNNRLRTASELGISRMGLYKKLHKYGLTNY